MILYVLFGLAVVFILFFVSIKPLLMDKPVIYFQPGDLNGTGENDESYKYNELLVTVADLELDYQGGKISEQDYGDNLTELKHRMRKFSPSQTEDSSQ